MKKLEIEQVIKDLKEIKKITDQQEYNVSTLVNIKYNSIIKVLDAELERMNTTNIEVNCPRILIVEKVGNSDITLTELINDKLSELTLANYKIIDYGFIDGDLTRAYIKYCS